MLYNIRIENTTSKNELFIGQYNVDYTGQNNHLHEVAKAKVTYQEATPVAFKGTTHNC